MAIDVYKEWLGIPDGERPPDHYQLLRLVEFEDDPNKIRAHYRKLNAHVRKYASGQYSVRSQELLNELAKAMLCLTDPERKREYDNSLGRAAEDETDAFGRQSIENVLREQGTLTPAQIKEVRQFAEARGLSMRDALVQMKLVDIEAAQQALAQQLGLSYVNLAEMVPDDSVLDKVPRNLVKRQSILPLFIDDDVLLVACTDDPSPELEEELQLRFGIPIRPVIATPLAINQGIAKYYAPGMREDSEADQYAASSRRGKSKKPARKPMSRLSPDEQRQRKLLLVVIGCWTIVGSVLLDWYVIKPMLFPSSSWPYYLTLVAPPIAVWLIVREFRS